MSNGSIAAVSGGSSVTPPPLVIVIDQNNKHSIEARDYKFDSESKPKPLTLTTTKPNPLNATRPWGIDSWRQYTALQQPSYCDAAQKLPLSALLSGTESPPPPGAGSGSAAAAATLTIAPAGAGSIRRSPKAVAAHSPIVIEPSVISPVNAVTDARDDWKIPEVSTIVSSGPAAGSAAGEAPKQAVASALATALSTLRSLPPLVSPHDIQTLQTELAAAARGQAFVLQAGHCAEAFRDCRPELVQRTVKHLHQLCRIVSNSIKQPIGKPYLIRMTA